MKRIPENSLPGLPPGTPESLPQLLSLAVSRYPEHGIAFVHPHKPLNYISFRQLEVQALSALAGLQASGLGRGDLVILSLESSEEIIPVLWACFIGGIVPALLQPPVSFTEHNPAAEKTEKVFNLLGTARVIHSHRHTQIWKESAIPPERRMDVKSLSGHHNIAVRVETGGNDLAMIQFSSGSTGDPKGVMLTHRNIIVNTADIIDGIKLEASDVSVNWMPLYHDMGLIGFHLTPVYAGVTQYFIDPVDFVKNPSLWLETMSAVRCTISACPNFGQMIVNRHLGRKPGKAWDLSSLRILFNGAEPISVTTMRTFLEGLQPFGLNPSAMFPAYGLAEATLAVTFPARHTGAGVRAFLREPLARDGRVAVSASGNPGAIELVNLGKPLPHCRVMIADDRQQPVEPGTVGHVLVRGPNVMKGYFADTGGSGRGGEDEWLHTGDLGFTWEDNLYVTGRSKDIIFLNGMNHYAHDLESLAARAGLVTEGKAVVTGYFDETEGRDRMVVFLVGSDNEETRALCRDIRYYFATVAGIHADIFVPVRSADIPRTSSGKIRRFRLTERYLRGELRRMELQSDAGLRISQKS